MISQNATLGEAARALRLRISIDGPAGSGKTTIGKGLAGALACPYLDTGLMYRAVAWSALQAEASPGDEHGLATLARSIHFSLSGPGESLLIDGRPPEEDLRSAPVDAIVSAVSAHPAVRREMVLRQRQMAGDSCIVMVGRDIGTVVLPDADVKLWIVASPAERARRRLLERLPGSRGVTPGEAERQISERDAQDSHRQVSPLRRPDDAVNLSTDRLTPEQSVQQALEIIRRLAQTAGRVEETSHG